MNVEARPEIVTTPTGSRVVSYKKFAKEVMNCSQQWDLEDYKPYLRDFYQFSEDLFENENDIFVSRKRELEIAKTWTAKP